MTRSLASGIAFTLLSGVSAVAGNKKQPNIIFFLVDDMGWVDSQVPYGEEIYPHNLRFNTPNMVRLAEQGVVLTNAYACPLSTPTRTSLMTGMHAAHEKITSFTSQYKDNPTDFSGGGKGESHSNEEDVFARGEWNWNGLYPVSEKFPLSEQINNTAACTPMVQLLKEAGYFTIHVGKAHWGSGGVPSASPYNMGFIVNVCGANISHPRSYLGEKNYGNVPELWSQLAVMNLTQYYGTHTFLTEALTREALSMLEHPIATNQPFYLNMSHHAVHTPITADDRFVQKYIDAGMDKKQAAYASMVEGVDKSLGDILDFIEKKGVADNTVIIFYSDNGGHSVRNTKGGIPHTQNAPLREGKASVYEGGIREPMIVKIPGKTKAGSRVDTPVSCEDFFPSILDIAGVKNYRTVQSLDGQSWYPLVTAKTKGDPNRLIIAHMPHQWRIDDQPDIDFMSAVRQGDWKFVYRMHNAVALSKKGLQEAIEGGAFELYNLRTDISERDNLAAKYPEKVAELARILSRKLRGWDATMPVYKATGQTCPLPDELL